MVNEDLLRSLFVKKSLKNNDNGFQLQMKNSISDATIVAPIKLEIKGESVEREKYKDFAIDIDGERINNKDIDNQNPARFSVKSVATLFFERDNPLPKEKYKIRFSKLLTEEYGDLPFGMKERIRE
ncbi:MAG: hypothetical protein JSV04_01575 [Candidatus Heimdallarchaeota archaeon]|nr:MAG: hypothetical protein JSV04_01575 [Candidatus Heimdallarchaeota archaeon]